MPCCRRRSTERLSVAELAFSGPGRVRCASVHFVHLLLLGGHISGQHGRIAARRASVVTLMLGGTLPGLSDLRTLGTVRTPGPPTSRLALA